ncbi:MAG: GNAT family N-acetyltransferase [Candidatus Cloacimonetes bacterium]|nr:GNAT family N-acetyltransferase [Candidatus Cloacimonadota bacterium]
MIDILIRKINPNSSTEIHLVAKRMSQTLDEVLQGSNDHPQYDMEWLINRVQQHTSGELQAQIYLASINEVIVGHTIVRIEDQKFGLFATTYVTPEFRNNSVASELIMQGERWILDQNLTLSKTYTDQQNFKLIKLFEKHGYNITHTIKQNNMLILSKALS